MGQSALGYANYKQYNRRKRQPPILYNRVEKDSWYNINYKHIIYGGSRLVATEYNDGNLLIFRAHKISKGYLTHSWCYHWDDIL